MTELALATESEQLTVTRRGFWRSVRRRPTFWICAVVIGLLALISLAPQWFAGWFGNGDPTDCDLLSSALPPEAGHPFGLDLQGCDIYSGVIYGTRTSVSVGVLTTVLCLIVALLLGTVAGYFGGWVDSVLARLTDVFLGFPFLLGAVVVLGSLNDRGPVTVSLVLALFSWPSMARLVRTCVRQVRDAEYVMSARAMGLRTGRILLRYVLPGAMGPVLALSTILVGAVIVAESTLTFLGVGLESPSISWGLQLASAQAQFDNYPHMLVFPSVFLTVTVLSLIALGDLLRDALNPRTR
ncbi:oligopeptide transport system permease protein [Nakamurella panacisegetis]|uniref:Oligopeptide transport system permease protein n=1 Tax=Nakamurella panacisegetis TaxID=1090615 RepID=A0A1H0S641_9ACTN|nr:ABC transporter permease [Nakamurella panacisegetis]SDP37184.1 oligopeptide transport system permease protein [Nakamurella panacisegetis]